MGDESEGCAAGRIEALVVDDSPFMRSAISNILERNGIDVIAEASDGHEAIETVEATNPDVVTMDLSMPRMGGLKAVDVIMNRHPTPILILSSHADKDAQITFDALERGAVDFFKKPGGEVTVDLATVEDRLVETVRSVAHADPPSPRPQENQATEPDLPNLPDRRSTILVIAASTGGPPVIERIMSDLPVEARFRVLIVQHMPASFTNRFAQRLDRTSEYTITEASDRTSIAPGEGVVAQGGFHLRVDRIREVDLRVALDDSDPVHNVKPAADVTLDSLATHQPNHIIGVVVSGMGADGVAGFEDLSELGATIIAQDEETSAVFGMPRRVIATGCVDEIVPKEELSRAIVEAIDPREDRATTRPSSVTAKSGSARSDSV